MSGPGKSITDGAVTVMTVGGRGGGKATSAYIDTRLLSAVTFTRATPRPSLAFPARKTGSKVGKHECATSCLCNAAALSAYSYSVVAWRAVAARQAAPYNLSLLTYNTVFTHHTLRLYLLNTVLLQTTTAQGFYVKVGA